MLTILPNDLLVHLVFLRTATLISKDLEVLASKGRTLLLGDIASSQDWRVVSEMPPGGDGDSGEKGLRAEVYGSFCLGCHTPVTVSPERKKRAPKSGKGIIFGHKPFPSLHVIPHPPSSSESYHLCFTAMLYDTFAFLYNFYFL